MADLTISMTRQEAHRDRGDIHGALLEEVEDRSYEGARWLTFLNRGLAGLHRADDPAANDRDESYAVDLAWFLFAAANSIPVDNESAMALVDTEAARELVDLRRQQPNNAPDVDSGVQDAMRERLAALAPEASDEVLEMTARHLWFIQRCAVAAAYDDEEPEQRWQEAASLVMDLAGERPRPAITTLDAITHVGYDHPSDVDRMSELLDEEATLHLGRPGECGSDCPAFVEFDVDGDLVAQDLMSTMYHLQSMCQDLNDSDDVVALIQAAISHEEDRRAHL